MSDYFLGEIRMFSFNWAPKGWALCNGSLMPVNQNVALNSLLGKTFGGDARTTFGLPDLRGRAPLCASLYGSQPYGTYSQGNEGMGGAESVTLTTAQAPIHTHSFRALSSVGTANQPTGGASLVSSAKPAGAAAPPSLYGAAAPNSTMAPLNAGTINSVGGNAHNNMQPFLVTNFCIATAGLYPPRQ